MDLGYNLFFGNEHNFQKVKREKGKSLLEFLDEYTVIDIETTGLSPDYDCIIELSAIKVKNGELTAKYSSLVKPYNTFIYDEFNEYYVDAFITELTGITNEMLETAPDIEKVLPDFLCFIGDSIIVGHNVNFDINFIYDDAKNILNKKFQNDYCDLMRISRRLFPNLPNHKLATLAQEFNIEQLESHRGLVDCITTMKCFEYCKQFAISNNIDFSVFKSKKLDVRKISPTTESFDSDNPFFQKRCVFTGKLERLQRADAAQIVVNLGGICENGVTKNTNFLILGNNDYRTKDGKSSKQKKAENLILKGQDLQIMPEDVFYDIINEYLNER